MCLFALGCHALANDVPADFLEQGADLEALKALAFAGDVTITCNFAELSGTGVSRFSGDVRIEREGIAVTADEASYDPQTRRFDVSGGVGLSSDAVEISADSANFDADEDGGRFRGTRFALRDQPGRGDADEIRTDGETYLDLRGVRYTACPEDEIDWRLVAREIRIDRDKETGTGRNVRVEFKGTPILLLPWLSFPVTDARKSGFLLPDYGDSDRGGVDISVPYYWNIAPNYDATLTARLIGRRGTQIAADGRYLTRHSLGSLKADFLGSDQATDDRRDRFSTHWQHTSRYRNGLTLRADVANVSDDNYFEDLSGSLAGTSTTHLERVLEANWRRGDWQLGVLGQTFQTIDPTIAKSDEPYKRLPSIYLDGKRDFAGGVELGVYSELAHFEREAGVRGQRLHIAPRISLPLRGAGYELTPSIGVDHVSYALSDLVANQEERPNATRPVYSLDGRLIFERFAGRDARLLQTVEPRLRYTHVPFVDQSDLPVFDTGLPDDNLVQLFQDNRYLGPDRYGDTDTLSVGLTTRLLDTGSGRELVSATLGQALYLSRRQVALPGRPLPSNDSSNLIAEIGFDISEKWNADVEYQWQSEGRRTAKSAVRVQYRRGLAQVVNLAYRFQSGDLEQGDLSFAWPVGRHWSVIGRWNYSLDDRETLERFAGIEYERCCWAVRLVSRRFVNDRVGGTESAFYAQFELKGLASIGTRVDSFLERGILSYGNEALP